MEKISATFDGEIMTLANVWQHLRNGFKDELLSILVQCKDMEAMAEQINRRDCYPDTDDMIGIPLRIQGTYSYGFDVYIGGSNFEIDCENGATEIEVYLLKLSTLEFVDGSPVPPAAEKVEVKAHINVASLSMDELADVVSTYDEVHTAAVKEMNNRLDTFRDKL